MTPLTSTNRSKNRSLMIVGLLTLAVLAVGLALWKGIPGKTQDEKNSNSPLLASSEKVESAGDGAEGVLIRFPQSKWKTAGLKMGQVTRSNLVEHIWRSGRLTLNPQRIAHLSPIVEGIVLKVNVRLGQDVKEGEVLALLDCREVGQAKLDLVKTRLQSEYARTQHHWTLTSTQAARELVDVMSSGASMPAIEKQFKDRPIGDMRQQLTTAYSRRLLTRTSFDAISQDDVQGAVSRSTVIQRRADYEAAEAAFRALCEEVKFQSGQQVRASEQRVREAETAEKLSKATLLMMGYTSEEIDRLDPIAEGANVSHFPLRAPFNGTIIEQHAVRSERVGPQIQMFQIADLTSLWVQADIQQNDLPMIQDHDNKTIRFRVRSQDPLHEAKVFYTGDIVDRETRTMTLSAVVENPRRLLKAGTFVEVEISRTSSDVLSVPPGAIQREGRQDFVFVHEEGEKFRRVNVKTGRITKSSIELLDGLKPGQSIVTEGGFLLKSEMNKE